MSNGLVTRSSRHASPRMRVLIAEDRGDRGTRPGGVLDALSIRPYPALVDAAFECVPPARAATRLAEGFDAVVITQECPASDIACVVAAATQLDPQPGVIVLMGAATSREIHVLLRDLEQRRTPNSSQTPLARAWAAAGMDALGAVAAPPLDSIVHQGETCPMQNKNWKDALGLLAEMGWESDEIEGACEALIDVCDENGEEPLDLSPRQIDDTIGDELTPEERQAFALVASVFAEDDGDTHELIERIRELE